MALMGVSHDEDAQTEEVPSVRDVGDLGAEEEEIMWLLLRLYTSTAQFKSLGQQPPKEEV